MPKWEHLHAERRLDLSLDLSAVLSADISADLSAGLSAGLSEALSLDLPLDLPAGLSLDPARFQLLPLWPWQGHMPECGRSAIPKATIPARPPPRRPGFALDSLLPTFAAKYKILE